MTAAFFNDPALERFLPGQIVSPRFPEELAERRWDLLALTAEGCRLLTEGEVCCRCRILLLPGGEAKVLKFIGSDCAVDYGLSPRNSLTLSGLEGQMVVCVQRTLPAFTGGPIEPQEIPLPEKNLPPEKLLVVSGIRLLMGRFN